MFNSSKFALFSLAAILFIFLCVGDSTNTKRCVETDKQALLKLKDGFVDEGRMLSSWNSEVDCCQWNRISCNNLTGHVTALDLQAFNYSISLRGNVDSSLCELRHLTSLNLNGSYFEGKKIPKCIGSLSQLRELKLANAGFVGTIPHELGNLSNLQTLDLGSNSNLMANDLEWISHLSSLRFLDLGGVNLSRAVDWQSSLSIIISSLIELHLDECELLRVISKSFFHMNSSTSLQVLSLRGNYLNSSIPYWVLNVSKVLVNLDLSSNTLQDIAPDAFINMTSLEYLRLSKNNLESSMVKSICNLCQLKELWLDGNNLSSQLSDWIHQLGCAQNSIKILDLGGNPFNSGPIPDFSKFSSLRMLYLYDAGLHGLITKSWVPSPFLVELNLSYNNLSGPLPDFSKLLLLTFLDLSDNNLSGPLPDFSKLLSLTFLELSENSLSGPLPDFSKLLSLDSLYLSHNNLSGLLPDFSKLLSLTFLDLSHNNLRGPLPEFSRSLPLIQLILSNNQLNGILPHSLRQLSSLVVLDLSSNKLNGVISEAHLSTLSSLNVLDVSHNLISFDFNSNWAPSFQLGYLFASSSILGPNFPVWLKYQRELVYLDISNGAISDSVPQWFWLSLRLSYFNISHNKIHGVLPKSLPANAYFWDLSFNNFSGSLPHFPPNAVVLVLSNNMFSGSISSFCANSQLDLSYLDLSSNLLSGRILDCWGQLQYLEVLNLANNKFSGRIQNSMGTLKNIKTIHLNSNDLSGEIPYFMPSSQLQFVDFGQNNLQGNLPAWIGHNLPNLIVLRLQSNKLQGGIPVSLCKLINLQILDLSQNNITGMIPHCLNNLKALSNMTSSMQAISYVDWSLSVEEIIIDPLFIDNAMLAWKGEDMEYNKNLGLMRAIDLSCNHLKGEIPSSITTLIALASLNLSRNQLTGFIPNSIGQMRMLESLDLSRNSISGEIPASFSVLSFLSYLDLSFNNLSGQIPHTTQLQTFNASNYRENQGLCGPPLTKGCPGDGGYDPNPKSNHNIDADGDDKLISFGFYVSLVFGFIIGFWGVCGTLVLKSSWRHAYFQFFINMNDWIYVQVVVFKARMKRRFQG